MSHYEHSEWEKAYEQAQSDVIRAQEEEQGYYHETKELLNLAVKIAEEYIAVANARLRAENIDAIKQARDKRQFIREWLTDIRAWNQKADYHCFNVSFYQYHAP